MRYFNRYSSQNISFSLDKILFISSLLRDTCFLPKVSKILDARENGVILYKISNLKSQISNLKSQISNLKSQISNLKAQRSALSNFFHGISRLSVKAYLIFFISILTITLAGCGSSNSSFTPDKGSINSITATYTFGI